MATFSVQEDGLAELRKRLENLSSHIQEEVVMEIQAGAMDIQGDARSAVQAGSSNYGRLAQSIQAINRPTGAYITAGAGVVYAPYVEWGTGDLVDVPNDLKDYAIQFKGQGIRKVNRSAKPYLFPALKKHLPLIIERIKKIIDDA